MLVPSGLSALLLDGLLDHIAQLGTVEEGARVLKDAVGAIISDLPDEEAEKGRDLWVLSEVLLVLDS